MSKAETDLYSGPEIDATLARLRKDRERTEAVSSLLELVERELPWVLLEPGYDGPISDVLAVILKHFDIKPKSNPAKEA